MLKLKLNIGSLTLAPKDKEMKFSRALLFLAIFSLPLICAACGMRGAPQPPGPKKDITYPKIYPPE
ncbi:hypothetical protein DM15PD_02940 [Aristophania vespae]|nr:hypothetical protein DM15PD_02940 [Aristophania vespae]